MSDPSGERSQGCRFLRPAGVVLSLAVGLAVVSIAPAQSASADEHARHAADKTLVKVALGEDDEVVLPSRVAAAIERTLTALARSEERVDDARFRLARKSLKAVRLDVRRTHRAGMRQMTAVPADEEAETTPGPDSVVAVLTVEQGAVTRLGGMYDTIAHHPRVIDRISKALSATLTYRDRMLNAVIALDPEGAGADYADGMADTVDGYADEIANLTEALREDQLSARARTALAKALVRSRATAAKVNAAFGGGE